MRVITGSCRGMRLKTLSGNDVRPTTDKVKEAIFSAIQFDIEGRNVLDLFAGSGQLGIEALSRGAASATFVDMSAESISVVKDNLDYTRLADKSKVSRNDFSSFIGMCKDKFDIVFLDPPYGKGILQSALLKIPSVISDHCVLICEHPTGEEMPARVGEHTVSKVYRYGKTSVTVYRKEA